MSTGQWRLVDHLAILSKVRTLTSTHAAMAKGIRVPALKTVFFLDKTV